MTTHAPAAAGPANELGLFEALADSPATLDALAARTGLTHRAARISADAMVALGLLDVEDGTYRNGRAAARFLAGPGPVDLRPFLRFWDKISYPAWARLAEALASGPPQEIFELSDDLQGITGAVLELPTAVELARGRVAAAGLQDRITVLTGDAVAGELPAGYDVLLLANLIHYWSADQNRELLERVRQAAQPGSALLLADFWTNPAHTEPLQALMAGEFAVHVRTGDVYSVDEARAWLDHTGWRFTDHRPLAGPQSLIVAEAA